MPCSIYSGTSCSVYSGIKCSDRSGIFSFESDELGGAARIAPVLYWGEDPEAAIFAAVDQARLTHRSARSLLVTDIFVRSAVRLLQGETGPIIDVLQAVRDERASQIRQASQDDVLVQTRADFRFFDDSLKNALKLLNRSARETAMGLGQSCHAEHALPVILNILAKNVEYRESLRINALIGGDSAARAMLIGLLLGIRAKPDEIPAQWQEAWKAGGTQL